jgi:glycosyltransferase involved in cell wall biosynthesis
MLRRVLFVSKPVAPPFHDGTKCLVRDVALHLRSYRATVMSARGTSSLGHPQAPGNPGVELASVYAGGGAYSPVLADNARAAAWLLGRSRADVWHFVFAPNPRTSAVGRLARWIRQVPVVQTVASPPLEFVPSVFFGDAIVAQSRWTRNRIVEAFDGAALPAPEVRVVPPPLADLPRPSVEAVAAVARQLDLSHGGPVFVYPGDLEVGRGAELVASAVPEILRRVPGATVVFACRPKTKEHPRLERELRARLPAPGVRFVAEVDLRALLVLCRAVLFPVDDLRGKVDLPISLLEAMQLGVPVVRAAEGPLEDLENGAIPVSVHQQKSSAVRDLADAAARLADDPSFHAAAAAAGVARVKHHHSAAEIAAAYERVYDAVLARRGAGS